MCQLEPAAGAGERTLPSVAAIEIRDVTPRDGLQSERPIPPSARAELASDSPKRACATSRRARSCRRRPCRRWQGQTKVFRELGAQADVRWWALVPNRRGVELARDCGIEALTLTISASDGYSLKNVRRTTEESIAALGDIVAAAEGIELDAVISCAFGSPFEDVTLRSVAGVVEQARGAGVGRVTLADTTGAATPRRVERGPGHRRKRRWTAPARHQGTALANGSRASMRASRGSTPRSVGSEARHSLRVREATSRPKTSCSCSRIRASTRASISTH